jgi:hypothetical protein
VVSWYDGLSYPQDLYVARGRRPAATWSYTMAYQMAQAVISKELQASHRKKDRATTDAAAIGMQNHHTQKNNQQLGKLHIDNLWKVVDKLSVYMYVCVFVCMYVCTLKISCIIPSNE